MQDPLRMLPTATGNFDVKHIVGNIYLLTLRGETKYIGQTGAVVTTHLTLPHVHRLLKLELKHTDNVDADNTDALAYYFNHIGIGNLFYTLRGAAAATIADILETFEDDLYIHPNTVYQLVTNTTNTHRLYVMLYIESLEV